jgi:hypothetical protein
VVTPYPHAVLGEFLPGADVLRDLELLEEVLTVVQPVMELSESSPYGMPATEYGSSLSSSSPSGATTGVRSTSRLAAIEDLITRGNWSITSPTRSGVFPSATAWVIIRVTMSDGAALVIASR